MHFEVLTEDASGGIAVNNILHNLKKALKIDYTFKIHSYKGIGRIPKNLKGKIDPQKRILLDRLPKILRGYGKSLQYMNACVLVVLDLDDKDKNQFLQELNELLNQCSPRPTAIFCLAIEEMEAWLLGDRAAVLAAFPNAKTAVLDSYKQDSICGTWELLADAIYPDGVKTLKRKGWPTIGQVKCEWAEKISPLLNSEENTSPSLQFFRNQVISQTS